MIRGPLLLEPGFQPYAWGDSTFLAALFGRPANGPLAEAWLGAHPSLPCNARPAGEPASSDAEPLDRLVAESGENALGRAVHRRFGELPFLVKLLAAARPLSVQVHPTRAQAEAGFAREEAAGISRDDGRRKYKDANPKPEILIALTPFSALVGFRPMSGVAKVLAAAPELAALLPPLGSGEAESDPDAMARLLAAYFALDEEARARALTAWLERLEARRPAEFTREGWIVRCHRLFAREGRDTASPLRPDPGVFLVALLNLVDLAPGQSIFLPAGVPHAYLAGAAIEVMAASDNVLRAGLTPKAVDVPELLSVVDFRSDVPHLVFPVHRDDGAFHYPTSAEEFAVRRFELTATEGAPEAADVQAHWVARGPEILLWLPATNTNEPAAVTLRCGTETFPLGSGGSCFVPHGASVTVLGATRAGSLLVTSVPDPDASATFRGREPTKLAFGTSGLRGLVTDITDLEAYANTRGFLDVLVARGVLAPRAPVALAGDLRPSTDSPTRSILRAVAAAVRDAGFALKYAGRIPTPALAAYAFAHGWPSIMVTGSHIPFDRNGIKFNKPDGEVLKADEAPIVASVERTRRALYAEDPSRSAFDDAGMFRRPPPPLPPVEAEAHRHYVQRYLSFFAPGALTGLRVVLFEHTAVGREIVAEALRGLGAEVIPVGRTETFVAIDTEAIPESRLAEMQRLAHQVVAQVGAFDALISTDGDSDRPMVFGAERDGQLTFVGGDTLGILVADALGVDALAVPVTATDAVERHFAGRGIRTARTKVGSPYVIDAMTTMPGERKVGWEANGGFLTFSPLTSPHGTLAPLPTRDALLPICTVLHAARAAGRSLAALASSLPRRFARAGLLDDIPVSKGRALSARYDVGRSDVRRVLFANEGGALVVKIHDHAGAENHLDDDLARRLREVHALVSDDFHGAHGFGRLIEIDYLDGLRLHFEGGDVAHVRASGNAPQLRIYALASDDARARKIVELALAEGGLLATMLARG